MTSVSMRSWLETLEGQQLLSLVHGWTRAALEMTGAVRVGAAFDKLRASCFPVVRGIEPEDVVACFERLVELGELRELTVLVTVDADRVFIRASRVEDSVTRNGGHDRRVQAAVTEGASGYIRELFASPQTPPPRGPLTAEEHRRVEEHVQFMPPEGRSRADRLMLERLEWEAKQERGELAEWKGQDS